jgi:phosphate transport system substrate-binding protein
MDTPRIDRWRRVATIVALLCSCAGTTRADDARHTPHYRPAESVSGTIRIWADEHMATVIRYWAEGFRKFQPQIGFETKLVGSGAAMPGIYHNVADLALLGRESDITDDNGFFKSVGGYKPLQLELMNGSLDVPGQSSAQVVFAHRDNPLSRLTVAQLDAIFGYEHRRGTESIRTWGQLGLTGEWSDKPIHLYAYDIESEDGLHFVRAVLADSRKLNWENLTEFSDVKTPGGGELESGRRIVDALRSDRYGLAISSARYAGLGVKPIAIAAHESAPYYQATAANVISRLYPLSRKTYAFLNQPPGKRLDPKMNEFMRYVLSREGQLDVARAHGYLPLSSKVLLDQLALLTSREIYPPIGPGSGIASRIEQVEHVSR